MDLRDRISRRNFKSQAIAYFHSTLWKSASRRKFRYEDFYSEFRGKIPLWNLDWNSRAKSRYKILIRIPRRHFKTKFRDLNFTQNKIPRFKISRRLMSCFVAPIAPTSPARWKFAWCWGFARPQRQIPPFSSARGKARLNFPRSKPRRWVHKRN